MNKLVIVAHPASTGTAHKIVDVYTKGAQERGHDVCVIDLYDPQWQQAYLAFEDIRAFNEEEKRVKIQEKMTWADELIIVYPMWWGGMPAVVKNFFDQNLTAHFAFTYSASGKPVGLLGPKTVRIFTTADGPQMMYNLLKPFFTFTIKNWIIRFCGMTPRSFDIFGNIRNLKKSDDIDVVLAKVYKRIV